MSQTYVFHKMTGGGNDFVVLDNRKNILPKNFSAFAEKVCDRRFSVGGDGLLVLENSPKADFRMVYFNSDGSRASMCGNGARCIARFAFLHKAAPARMHFVTDVGILEAEIKKQTVKLQMAAPKDLKLDFDLQLKSGKKIKASFLNTGVPHAVVLVRDVEKINVDELGREIRFHKFFGAAGTNVNFVSMRGKKLSVRTYERGVEGETLACGTGITASAIICGLKGKTGSPASCLTRGGATMQVYFQPQNKVYLEGPADVCFKGEITL